jgi:hypothetical protein
MSRVLVTVLPAAVERFVIISGDDESVAQPTLNSAHAAITIETAPAVMA